MPPSQKKALSSSTPAPSRLLAPAPPAEYIKRQLAAFHRPKEKDPRTLAASTSAIALSFVSPACDPNDMTPDEFDSSKESAWKTAYGTARIAVEIAKESSGLCPPLKAVTGVLSVLIKNCDQTIANVNQIKGVEERIESLSDVLTSPVGEQDVEEKARREVLRKKLAGILDRLEPLSERHGFMKFLNNVEHANALNGFVKELSLAITDYQTSLQQNIYENTRGIEEVRNEARRIDETTRRVDETASRIDETTRRTDATARRANETTTRINETTKELNQTVQTISKAAELDILAKLNPVHNAGYQAGHHDTCLSGTRESVLKEILGWAKDPRERRVFWLNGLAGTGKSTIAQTFSKTVAEDGTLGASFFCSRDYLDRKELKNIFPTLAHQLACRYPPFRSQIIATVNRDPSIVPGGSLISQLQELIIAPLSLTNISCVIVIDALDECIDDQPASAILSVLGRCAEQLSSVKFFITGRPEPRIRRGFRLPLLKPLTEIFLLHGVELSIVDEDIRLYLQEKLNTIAKLRSGVGLSNPWPCPEDLKTLTKKSKGLFIFASTLVRFIESEDYEPGERLRLIVNSPDNTAHEGGAGIDTLYTQVLMHAFSGVKDATKFANYRRVLGAVANAFDPLSRIQIAEILGISRPLITTVLQHLHSVLLIPNEDSEDIRIFHKSFPDFLQDSSRCANSELFIDSAVHHADMALGCLKLLKKLEPNPCDLPDFVMNQDVAPGLLKDRLGSAMRYACWYWAMHLRSSPTTGDYATQLVVSATKFFKNNAVPWIEVMSLENRLEGLIHGIYGLLDWIGMTEVPNSDLCSRAQDCLRFTMHFFPLLQHSAPHVYHSALPLSPGSSAFSSMVLQGPKTAITRFHGRPDAWGALMRTIRPSSGYFTCTTTVGRWIAAARNDGMVEIYDSITGALRLSLRPIDRVQTIKGSIDGSMLFCAHWKPSISVWDIQTGGPIHTLTLDDGVEEIAICSEGRYIAYGLSDGSIKIGEGKTESAAFGSGPPITHLCWLESGKQLVVARGALAQVWDVVAQQVLHSSAKQGPIRGVVFAPKLKKFAVVATSGTESTVTIVDSQTHTSFTNPTWRQISCFAFSQITEELICGMSAPGLELFNIQARDWKQFNHPAMISSISTLSNGVVVTNVIGTGIQLLSLDEGYSPPQQAMISACTLHALDQGNIIAVLPTRLDQVTLLGSSTMSPLLTIPNNYDFPPTYRFPILCASFEHRIAVHIELGLSLWRFGGEAPEWTCRDVPLYQTAGGISPSGSRLVVLYGGDLGRIEVLILDVQSGEPQARRAIVTTNPHTQPLQVEFESEERFYSQHDTCRILYVVFPSQSDASSDTDATLQPDTWPDLSSVPVRYISQGKNTPAGPIIRFKELDLSGQPGKCYDVDSTHEWVICCSKRICWIPPGYIGSGYHSHCWAGHTLVMVGHDGVLRTFTFRAQSVS